MGLILHCSINSNFIGLELPTIKLCMKLNSGHKPECSRGLVTFTSPGVIRKFFMGPLWGDRLVHGCVPRFHTSKGTGKRVI